MNDARPLGLYVHIPFCRRLCPYCDFAVAVRREPPHDAYADALLEELAVRGGLRAPPATVYFGGGTPAYWALDALKRFVEAVPMRAATEVTIEANPNDITPGRLSAWAEIGINRISLGVQSFDDEMLVALGRDHSGELAEAAARMVVEDGRFRSSLDLIFGGPGAAQGRLLDDIERVASIGPDHVSAYELSVEEGTVFGRRQRAGTLGLPPDRVREDLGFSLVEHLAAAGYERYEVSSYGRRGDVAIHNSGYWTGRDYLGLGMGAHSLSIQVEGAERRSNVRNLKQYLLSPGAAAGTEVLSATEHLGERLFLASRTRLGVAWSALRDQFRTIDEDTWQRVDEVRDEMSDAGYLEADPVTLRATARGLDVADWLAERFWQAAGHPHGP